VKGVHSRQIKRGKNILKEEADYEDVEDMEYFTKGSNCNWWYINCVFCNAAGEIQFNF